MKKKYTYYVNGKKVEREYNYIPVRYIVAVLLTVLSVLAVIGIVVLLCYYVPYFYIAAFLTEIGCILKIVASDDDPDYKVPWLLIVLTLPIVGFMVYFMFYSRTLQKKFIRRLGELRANSYEWDDSELLERLRGEDVHIAGGAKMLMELSGAHLFTNTKQTYFPSGEEMLPALLCDLQNAEKFIYMEYFIIEEGSFWDPILELLKRKASEGVEVKLLYDDIGCMMTLPGDYARELEKYGIEAAVFSKLRGNADSEFNNRSHRKITVIDGKIGYTGGINIADEYINAVERFGHWKDTAIRLEGDAVLELCRLFVEDFGISVRQMPRIRHDIYRRQSAVGEGGYLIPFGDGPRPIYNRRVAKSAIENMLACASEYVYMTTPYLIPDNELCRSIESASLRGVKIKIIVPHVPDKKLVLEMTRSFYPRLMSAGVEIYEYTPGFIHAKTYLADGNCAIVGTVNLDYRSLVHNFEDGVWMYATSSIDAIREDMEQTLQKSMRITEDALKCGTPRRVLRGILRIFAPMM